MSLIDLYVGEVGKRLPRRSRRDIQDELRSTLQDMLEDRSRKAGRPADEAMESDLLKEYGSPEKVAATYHQNLYLIGPRLYPFFVRVLQIVLAVLTVVLLITQGIELVSQHLQGLNLLGGIGKMFATVLGADLQAFGNIALVFAILERVLPPSEQESFQDKEKKEWDPASLVKEADKTEVKLWDPITNILFTVAGMVLFNLYPQLVALSFIRSGAWISIPVLTEAFFRWLPYLNVLWALTIVLNLILIRQGRWQPATRWFSVALHLIGIGITFGLLSGPSILSLSPAALQQAGQFTATEASTLSTVVQSAGSGILALVLLLQGVDVVKDVLRLVRKQA